MAHSFDTGLARSQRSLLRAGAVELLAGLLRPTGYLAAVVPFGGIVRGYTDGLGIEQLQQALVGRSPGVAIALGDRTSKASGIGGFEYQADLELLAYFYSNHPRDLELGRHESDIAGLASDTADPGLDVIMEHVEELLVGQRAGGAKSIKQVRPVREEELLTNSEGTFWVQRYAVTLNRHINAHRGVQELLTELRTKVRTTDDAMAPPAAPVVEVQSKFTP